MYVCMYVCMYVYMCMYVCACMSMHVSVRLYFYLCNYGCMFMFEGKFRLLDNGSPSALTAMISSEDYVDMHITAIVCPRVHLC
jgi:hypothetical protein